MLGTLLAAVLYAAGWRRLRRRAGGRAAPPPWRVGCYAGGLATLWLALLSPVATLSSLFFFLHMTQHLLLVTVAAPLIWLGAPLLPVLWALPLSVRRPLGRLFVSGKPAQQVGHFLTHPLVANVLFVGAIAFWHLPSLYDAAQGRTDIHDLEHLVLLGTALLYWWPVIHPTGGRRRLSYAAGIPYLFPAFLEGNLLGALLTFAGTSLYETYQKVPRLWGISVLQDQQLAGLIMWVPGGFVYLVPMLVLLARLFREEERAADARLGHDDGLRSIVTRHGVGPR